MISGMPRIGEKMPEEQKAKIRASLKARGLPPTKRCPRCDTVKDRAEFGLRKNGHSRSHCRDCELTAHRKWREVNGPLTERSRRVNLDRWFRLTEEDYQAMLTKQGGHCALCGRDVGDRKRRLYVDHCHRTGLIRGLLCANCNTGLGMFADDPDRLARAIEYLAQEPGPEARYVAETGRTV